MAQNRPPQNRHSKFGNPKGSKRKHTDSKDRDALQSDSENDRPQKRWGDSKRRAKQGLKSDPRNAGNKFSGDRQHRPFVKEDSKPTPPAVVDTRTLEQKQSASKFKNQKHFGPKIDKSEEYKALAKTKLESPDKTNQYKMRRQSEAKELGSQEAQERIADILYNHDIKDLNHEVLGKLTKFFFLLLEEQSSHNSTRLRTLREVAIKHYVDCLIVPTIVKLNFPLLDVGTGPGFPGIPLKILYPNDQIILAEGVQKRVEFLKRVREILKLEKLDIIGRQVNADFLYPVPAVITRAFAEVSETMNQVQNCLQKGGKLFLMKGPNVDPEISKAKAMWGTKFKLLEDKPYVLPHTPHERRLLVYEKL